ncbi:MAG: LptF/LptG family permease [Elusimicrobiales bacterium]|nr:LptF/LptG family permease [Elusimicrobiales bacterium]
MFYFLKINLADKIILKYYLKYFISSLSLFISIFFLFSFLQIINDKDISKGLSLAFIIKAIIYLIPSVMNNSLIFSTVFSVFFTIGELSLKGEITALRCCGYSYYNFIIKIIILTVISVPILYYLNHTLIPSSKLKSKHYIRTMINRSTNINLKSNSFEKISSSYIIAKEVTDSSFKNISIIRNLNKQIEDNKKADSIIHIEANYGTYKIVKEKGILISLINGKLSYLNKQTPQIFYQGSFDEYITFIPFEINIKNYDVQPKFIPTSKLKKHFELLNDNEKVIIKKEILSRTISAISLPFITFLALITALIFEKESKYFSFLASILIILIYYGTYIISNNIFKKINVAETELIPTLTIFILGLFLHCKILSKK